MSEQAMILGKVRDKSKLIAAILLRLRDRHRTGKIGGSYFEAQGLQGLIKERAELQIGLNKPRLAVDNGNEKEALRLHPGQV